VDLSEVAIILRGGQVLIGLAVTRDEPTAQTALTVLLFTSLAVAITVQVLADPLAGIVDRLAFSRYSDLDAGRHGFTRTDLDVRQFVSFLAERRVLAGRVSVSTTDPVDGAKVPFYLLPALGGNDTLRGFRANRFRGAHALLLQAEYRFEIWSALEGALFVDAGKVADRRADLDLHDLERDYGFGFRFNTDNGIIARIDAAFGSRDGRHLHVVFGGIF